MIPSPIPEQVSAWRDQLQLNDNKLVGFAGRFVEEKGFDFLLKSIPLVVERIPEAKFVYAGEVNVVYESFYEKWRHLVDRWSDHVIMLGLLSETQKVANFYALCDVLALPSRTDCFPMVQIEAMLCGTPAVASDIPGLRVPVRMTGMGRLVRGQDERALADGIVEVLSNRQRYLRPRQEIDAIFSLDKAISEYEGLFRSLV
jgi:glycosyltransferase involved in cell wall biosynthesis